jgi:hypothetical protein
MRSANSARASSVPSCRRGAFAAYDVPEVAIVNRCHFQSSNEVRVERNFYFSSPGTGGGGEYSSMFLPVPPSKLSASKPKISPLPFLMLSTTRLDCLGSSSDIPAIFL